MIDTSVLAEFIANVVGFLFSFLDGVNLSPIATAIETVTPFLKAILYILPAKTMGEIFAITCALFVLRIAITTVKLIWDLLPLA